MWSSVPPSIVLLHSFVFFVAGITRQNAMALILAALPSAPGTAQSGEA